MIASSELLSRFADAGDTSARCAALVDLVKARELHKAVGAEPLQRGLERLAGSAGGGPAERERLLAVAALQRAAAAAPPIRQAVRSLLRDAVTRPFSNLHALPDVDERLYAAKLWRVVPSAWPLDALAAGAAREAAGEAVRKECIEGLVELAGDVSEAISALRKALLSVTFGTKKPGDSLGRRLSRVLGALAAVLSAAEKPVGETAGREASELLDRAFRVVGRPESPAVRTAVVEQAAVLTHAIVRVDFSHADRYKTYEALSVASEWFAAHEWQALCAPSKKTRVSQAIARVSQDVQKALVSLARRGVTDDRLRRALATASGSRRNADAICRRMATDRPGIPDDVRDWLAGASKRTSIASAVESQERSIDEVIGELLLAMKRLTSAADHVRSEVLPEVSIVLPHLERALSRVTGQAEAMASKLSLAVAWRSLRLRGAAGDEVDFSPVEHQLDAGGARSRRVRLLRPVVERVSEDGVPRVVLKAPVEPIADGRPGTAGASA